MKKLAAIESKVLVKLQTSLLYKWATEDPCDTIGDAGRERLLDMAARVYELIENLPETRRTVKGN